MREEKYYGVFDYGDRLTPGVELKIEHTVVESIPLWKVMIKTLWI